MNLNQLLSRVDHTNLSTTATLKDIYALCDDGIKYGVASVCIHPCYVKEAKKYVGDRLKLCTVIGFPNGYNTAKAKVFEAKEAVKLGADEVDMVINIGLVKARKFSVVYKEIAAVRKATAGAILKVIVEACDLTEKEKIKLCEIVTAAGADYIKTSTGFSKSGATVEDVKLFRARIGANVKIKAAGGIRTAEAAEALVAAGADRLGASALVKLKKEEEK